MSVEEGKKVFVRVRAAASMLGLACVPVYAGRHRDPTASTNTRPLSDLEAS